MTTRPETRGLSEPRTSRDTCPTAAGEEVRRPERDGRVIAVGGGKGLLGLFPCDVCVSMDALLKLAAERSPRDLTEQERKDLFETGS